jgi:hypothetical protein
MDPIIQRGMWTNELDSKLRQVTLEGGRYYTDDSDERYYSVSTILEKTKPEYDVQILEKWRAKIGAEAAEEIRRKSTSDGTAMHSYIERYLLEGYEVPAKDKDDTTDGYTLFKRYHEGFLAQTHIIPRLIEAKIRGSYNGYNYAGTVDYVADVQLQGEEEPILTIGDHKSINDISKASSRKKNYAVQLAAYAKAIQCQHGVEIRRGILGFASQKGFKLLVIDFDELSKSWNDFYERLERFHLEEMYK